MSLLKVGGCSCGAVTPLARSFAGGAGPCCRHPATARTDSRTAALFLRIGIKADHELLEPRRSGRISLEHLRIVSRDHVIDGISELPDRRVSLEHIADVEGDREHASLVHVRIQMRRI